MISGAPALPVATARTVSEVDVSPSTVIELNVRSQIFVTRACNVFWFTEASVKTKASIVAMSGAIIPDPLAIPQTDTSIPSNAKEVPDPLG